MLLNGQPLHTVTTELLRATTYAHFTSMQVRSGHVDGLDLHLERLDRSTREVFGRPLAADRVRSTLRAGLDRTDGDATFRLTIVGGADLLLRIEAPIAPATTPLRLQPVEHQRALPHLKHTGSFDLIYFGRRAQEAGYDDAVFHNATGAISEATIWNICFARGATITFPSAPVLNGIRQQVLQRGLADFEVAPVHLNDLPTYDAAYLTNSIDPALPVAAIGTVSFEPHAESAAVIAAAYASQQAQAI
nr:aminotransferase class IV [Kribbella sandramycini]